MNPPKKAVLLMSGGLDSTTVLALLKSQGHDVYALSFKYGQRHEVELEAVALILKASPVKDHKIIELDLRAFGGSALTSDIEVPKSDSFTQSDTIPLTYVPARNTLFLSFALAYAEVLGSTDIYIGVNAIDYSNYPDCRPEFIDSFQAMANLATRAGVTGNQMHIHAPLLHMTKAQIIKTGIELGVDYSLTNSCYDPVMPGSTPRDQTKKSEFKSAALACGRCDACHLRLGGFKENNLKDPAPYVD